MSTYFPNIPQSTDNPANSQPLLLSNFQALDAAVGRNHEPMSDTTNSGRHVVVEMKEQGADPAPVATYGSLYVKDDAGTQNLYFQDESSVLYKLTNSFNATGTGSLTLPGGLIINWGSVTSNSGGVVATFDTAFSSSVFSVVVTSLQNNPSNNSTVSNISNSQCTIHSTAVNASYYIAIGV